MPSERSDVKYPLWRKKMDGAMFDDKCTVLPIWVRNRLFNVEERFPHRSKKHQESETTIVITHKGGKNTEHIAHVTTLPRPGLGPVMRLQFGNDVKIWLTETFKKTYRRNEERKSHGLNGPTIEKLIPFWEFIDIEWDEDEEIFHFRAWYSLESNDSEAQIKSLDPISNEIKQPTNFIKVIEKPIVDATNDEEKPKEGYKLTFQTDCGHTVKTDTVKKIGGKMEGRLYAKITGPSISGKSGIKTLYYDKEDNIHAIVNNHLKNRNHKTHQRKTLEPSSNFSAWLVLQNPYSIYADVEGECYEYPRSIPNGTRIAAGDYLICSLKAKNSKNGKRIFGIGRINRVQEFLKDDKKMRKAFYEWYREFLEPKTFEFIGGDPRVNEQHSMNPIPKNRVNKVVNLLVGEFSEDYQVVEKEMEYLANSSSTSTPKNQFPDWLTQALNNTDN